jgi:hypothetical protein
MLTVIVYMCEIIEKLLITREIISKLRMAGYTKYLKMTIYN